MNLSYARWEQTSARLIRTYRGDPGNTGLAYRANSPYEIAWLITRGSVAMVTGRRTFIAKAGQWLFAGPGPREHCFEVGSELFSLIFQWNDRFGRPLYRLDSPCVTKMPDDQLERAGMRVLAAFKKAGEPVFVSPQVELSLDGYLGIQVALQGWLAIYAPIIEATGGRRLGARREDERVTKACTLLDAAALSDAVDYDELAGACGSSRPNLERLFRAHLDLSPHGYVERRRREYARSELLAGERSIKEISAVLGFDQLPGFSRWFSRKEGMSPREFRARGMERA